jgi:hypothetical protein
MFWVIQLLTVAAALVCLEVIRRPVQRRFPSLTTRRLEIIAAAIIIAIVMGNVIVHEAGDPDHDNVIAVRDYGEIAKQGPTGETGIATFPLVEGGHFIETLRPAWTKSPGKIIPICNDDARARFTRAAELQPNSPWGHYGLAYCGLCRNDPVWRDHARRVIDITHYTTLLAHHDKDHDKAHEDARAWLAEAPTGGVEFHGAGCGPATQQ